MTILLAVSVIAFCVYWFIWRDDPAEADCQPLDEDEYPWNR